MLTRRYVSIAILIVVLRFACLRYGKRRILAVQLLVLRQQGARRQAVAEQQQRLREQCVAVQRRMATLVFGHILIQWLLHGEINQS